MLLDSNNCFHIENLGILVFFPEIGDILFYKDKPGDKILTFSGISLGANNILSFTGCKPLKTEPKTFIGKVFSKGDRNILFSSANANDLFKNFFIYERLKKQEIMKQRRQIDYLLVIKQSSSKTHTSKTEPRILRIDWANSIIKYYGEDAFFQINDFTVPIEFPQGQRCKLRDFRTQRYYYPEFEKQLALNGYAQLLADESYHMRLYADLLNHLEGAGFFKRVARVDIGEHTRYIETILGMLDCSMLKNNWIGQFTSDSSRNQNFARFIGELTSDVRVNPITSLKNLAVTGLGRSGYIYLINDIESIGYFADKSLDIVINLNSARPTQITANNSAKTIRFILNKDTLLSGITSSLEPAAKQHPKKINNCGADNCYFNVKDNAGVDYGLRISSIVYTLEDVQLYNYIIENLINAILYYYFNNPELIQSNNLPEITKVVKFGLIKVSFTTSEQPGIEKDGYIPYTITEYKPNYITLAHHINNLCNPSPNPLEPCIVEIFIKKVLEQVYNFFVIARPYFKFSHNDFKINNILINPENGKLYLIDFGYSQINLSSSSRIFYFSNRIYFDPETDMSDEYDWYLKNIDETYSADNDIETLVYWLKNYFEEAELQTNPNKQIYKKTADDVLEFLTPITIKKPGASKDTKTTIGFALFKNPTVRLDGSPLIYRLYQIYTIFKIITSRKCPIDYKIDYKLIEEHSLDFYRKYVIGYTQDEFYRYQSIIIPLFAGTSSSVAGGNRHYYKTIKKTNKTLKYKTTNKNVKPSKASRIKK